MRYIMRGQNFIAAFALSVCGTSAFAVDCPFWGDFATTLQNDYEARLREGQSGAFQATSQLLSYSDNPRGTMGRVYADAILSAIEARLPQSEVFAIGENVCRSYPEGTFDPDSLG